MSEPAANMPLGKVKKVKSTESTQSMVITGPAARQDLTANSSVSGIDSSVASGFSFSEGTDPVTDAYNCASVILYCTKHDVFALSEVRSKSKRAKGLTLPTIYVSPKMGFRSAVKSKLNMILANEKSQLGYIPYDTPLVLQKVRIQLPYCRKFVARIIFKSAITKESDLCCKDVESKNIRWVTLTQMQGMYKDLWGPDPVILTNFIKNTKYTAVYMKEMPLRFMVRHLPREVPKDEHERFLKYVGYTERDVSRLLAEFIQHCYPERFMSQTSLATYLKLSNWAAKDKAVDFAGVFRAFSIEKQPYLQFHEFLLGLAASEPDLKHQDVAAVIRNRCIMRFYSTNGDGTVDKQGLRKLVEDSFAAVGETTNEDVIVDNVSRIASVDGSKLIQALNKNTLTGCGRLFRGSRSFARISESTDPIVYDLIDPSFDPRSGKQKDTDDQKCDKCLEKKYMIAPFKVQLTRKEKDGSGGRIVNPEVIECTDNQNMDPAKKEIFARNINDETDDRKILSKMPECLWLKDDGAAGDIVRLCERVLPHVRAESSLVEVSTPCYVFGAPHGSVNHLNEVSKIIFPRLPMFELGSFVFLGNFLSGGAEHSSLQSLIFLLVHKSLCPQRFIILRGLAELQGRNELQAQVKKLIKIEADCKRVCQELFNVLDQLPLAAVINSDVLCVSSGIPHSAERLSDISDTDAADSIKKKIAAEILSLDLVKDGEIEAILSKLSISRVLRSGKEFSDRGFSYRLNGLVVTLSASHGKKPFGMAFVNENRIRLMTCEL